MKKIIKYICYTISIGLVITSCDDSDFTNASVQNFTDGTVTLSTSQSSYTFNESSIDENAPATFRVQISATLAQAQAVNTIIKFKGAGTANSSDYTIGNITILSGQTSGSTNLEILKTGDIEGTESLTLTAIPDGNVKLSSSFSLPVSINGDYVNDLLETTATWAGSYSYVSASGADVTLDFCNIDFDILLFTSTGAYVQAMGATGSCEEHGEMTGLPDGDYLLAVDLYDNPFSPFGVTEDVPISFTYSQEHFGSGAFEVNLYTVSDAAGLYPVASITKSGYNYTVTPL